MVNALKAEWKKSGLLGQSVNIYYAALLVWELLTVKEILLKSVIHGS